MATTGEVQFAVSDSLCIYVQGVTNTLWAIATARMVLFVIRVAVHLRAGRHLHTAGQGQDRQGQVRGL